MQYSAYHSFISSSFDTDGQFFVPVLLLAALLIVTGCARIDEPGPSPIEVTSGTLRISKRLMSWKDIRDHNVVMQRFDYSCGAAAMATLMNYYFGDQVTEADVLT